MINTINKIKKNIDLLKEYGSPLYIYDYDVLKSRINNISKFKKNLEDKLNNVRVSIHYSSKANNNPNIIKMVKEAGLLVDAMSPLELDLAKKCNFDNNEILYVCNNIDKEEMKIVHDSNILICLDSISQVEMWGELFPNTNIMVRINPGINGVGHNKKVVTSGYDSKFGICEENINKLLEIVNKYNLHLIGIHQHLGSLFLDDKVDDYINGVKESLRIIKDHFKNISIVDLGGGFGVPYKEEEKPLNLTSLSSKLSKILNEFIKDYKSVKEFKFEIGRYIPCEAGIIIGTVNAIKYEKGTYWIGTDIGMNTLLRPSMYNSYHKISLLNQRKTKKVKANVCGNICESGDIIGRERQLTIPKVNDKIIIHNAGAYGYSMSSNYTGRARPAELMLYRDKIKLIRKRETIESMEDDIVW